MTVRTQQPHERSMLELDDFLRAVRDPIADGESLELVVGNLRFQADHPQSATLIDVLEAIGSDGAVEAHRLPAEMTTGQAASLLGVSRPTVVALVDRGEIPATRVGAHRRVRREDVLAYRAHSRSARRTALAEVVEISDDLGLYDS